jgi:alpha-L-rhamnosidase
MKGYIRYMLNWTDAEGIMYSQVIGPDGKPNKWVNLGEWVAPTKLPPDEMVHTFYLWRCADLTSRTARVLGNSSEASQYAELAEKTRTAFIKRFYDEAKGSYGQYGGNIFALRMGVPADRKDRVIAALKADIAANKGNLDTGIFGTQFFFEVLADNGMQDLAYEAMNKRTMPSYGWWIEQGATTSWEEWDRPGSGNHPMFGGGIVWFYRKLAGMSADPENPGYKHIIFRPQPAGGLDQCSYSNITPFGLASVDWQNRNGKFRINIIVPPGSRATVYVPSTSGKVKESGKKLSRKSIEKQEGKYSVLSVGSGSYSFESEF